MKGKRYVFKGRSMRRLSPILEVHPGQSFVVMDDNAEMVELFKDCQPPLFDITVIDGAKNEIVEKKPLAASPAIPTQSIPQAEPEPEKIVRNLGRKIKKEK